MFDRVVAALALVVLMLFSATAALACKSCAPGTVQCLVALESQAEEVPTTDLESIQMVNAEGECVATAEACSLDSYVNLISGISAKAAGAAGGPLWSIATPAYNVNGHQPRTGRFSGATA